MVVLNLSENYRRNGNPSFMERLQLHFEPDVYHASNFDDIERHFDSNPPRKRGFLDLPSATVIMEEVGVRKYRNDYYFDDNNPEHLKALDDAEHFPAFEIDDSRSTRVAFFSGTTMDYLHAMNLYGITKEAHIRIPNMRLQYIELSPWRIIRIESFGSVERPVKENLLERIVRKNDAIGLVRF